MTKIKSDENILAEHFFRHEYAKMVAVITRYFGLEQLNLAEDIVQDTLLEAITSWDFKGIPENPTAWLYTVAKNKALNALSRTKYQQKYESEFRHLRSSESLESSVEEVFAEEKVADDQLRMMFACCHPSISPDAQITLMLKTLCGLSIHELANAYLTAEDTINKRLVRARKTLRQKQISLDFPAAGEMTTRLETVIKSIYLLFNEGYNASNGKDHIRFDLCMEAIRLAKLISENRLFRENTTIHALLALMLLNAARFNARIDNQGMIIEMEKQDRRHWHQPLIAEGLSHLEKIKKDEAISDFHFMAAISAIHCTTSHYQQTDWKQILSLYDGLLMLNPSPIVKLNRTVAYANVHGYPKAILQAEALLPTELKEYHHLHSTLAEFYLKARRYNKACSSLVTAIQLNPNEAELKLLKARLTDCQKHIQ